MIRTEPQGTPLLPKPQTDLSPRMQLWVTAVSLVVGFMCGLSISFFFGYGPSLQKLAESDLIVKNQNEEIQRLRRQEALDHAVLQKLAATRPEVLEEIKTGLDIEAQAHLNELANRP